MGAAVIFVIMIASAVTYGIYYAILAPLDLEYLQTIVFILVIAALVQLVEMILKKFVKPLYQALGVYLPLITTNCAVLGVAISNIDNGYNFGESLSCSFGTAVGFLIAIVILAGIREKSENNNIPKPFQGTPIVLISAGLMAIAFTGFTGVI
jgi:electron transport complex protein RnfA